MTRQIAQLENALGIKLMTRSTRRLTLTSAGSAYLEKCREILDLIESAETELAKEHQTLRGVVRISLPLSYGLKRLAPLLLDFAEQHPEVQLEMHYNDRRVDLIEEGVDLAIRVTHRLADSDIVRKIGNAHVFIQTTETYCSRLQPMAWGLPANLISSWLTASQRGASGKFWSITRLRN